MRAASVSVTGVAVSPPLVLDVYAKQATTVQLTVGSACTVAVQGTLDNVFDPTVVPQWTDVPVAALVGATANQLQVLPGPFVALRLNQTAGANTSVMKAQTAGLR